MSLSGFPDFIDVVLGAAWDGTNGLAEDEAITLQKIPGQDAWSENGTDTPDPTGNRIKAIFSSPDRVDVDGALAVGESPVDWTPGGMWQDTGGGTVYTFLDLFNGTSNTYSVGTYFLTSPYTPYNSRIFKSMQAGSAPADQWMAAMQPQSDQAVPLIRRPPPVAIPY